MENKYYTPTMEEFYVGFEYEEWEVPVEDNFRKVVVSEKDFYKHPYCEVRVKYLDQEDIESLGWKEEIESDGRFSILKDDIWYYLIQYGHNHKYEIRCMHPSYKYGSFLGIIKNKSELSKLMKQIGI